MGFHDQRHRLGPPLPERRDRAAILTPLAADGLLHVVGDSRS
jgi:hypothetical protein